jgi:hypothetical protein
MQPRDRLTAKEIQVATLVWLAGILRTSEQVVKNYLRTAFDKLGSLDSARTGVVRGGSRRGDWHVQVGNGPVPTTEGWSLAIAEEPQLPVGASKGQATAAGGVLLGSRCGCADRVRAARGLGVLGVAGKIGERVFEGGAMPERGFVTRGAKQIAHWGWCEGPPTRSRFRHMPTANSCTLLTMQNSRRPGRAKRQG